MPFISNLLAIAVEQVRIIVIAFVYSELRCNEPLYNEVLGITNDFFLRWNNNNMILIWGGLGKKKKNPSPRWDLNPRPSVIFFYPNGSLVVKYMKKKPSI